MDASISTAVVRIDSCFADSEELALAGFLAGYRGSTRDAYALDLPQFAVWCGNHKRRFFEVNRVDIECFGRELEARGRARATIARRLCTIAGFYRYAEEEGLIAHYPRCMCAVLALTTSRTRLVWIATSSARCLSRRVCPRHETTRWCRCWR
jgi:site-specific recombinase XerD